MFHLGWFLYEAVQGWGSAEFDPDYGWAAPRLHQDMAQKLEQACFDFILLEDLSAVPDTYRASREVYLREAIHAPKFDPAVMATLIAAATSRIGIIPTLTTSFYPPFLLARQVQTLDLLTGGRGGWNMVTSSSEQAALNFGMTGLPEHDERYIIADEYVRLCKRLWDSWEPDAVLADTVSGVFADHAKVHEVNFAGAYYAVKGPLNVPPSPQGRPILAQAGASPQGRRFAARHADIVLTPVNHPPFIKAFRNEIRRLAVEEGRDPDVIKVMAVAFPHICRDDAEARTMRATVADMPVNRIEAWIAQISAITGIDLAPYDLDEPLPAEVDTNGSRGTLDWLRSGGATIREMALRMARRTPDTPMIGTASQVADEMAAVMEEVGGDGFLIAGPLTPMNVGRIVDDLIPVLQQRGQVRSRYAGATLRDHLGEF